MDEGETKICYNCKREIPAVNFTIHSVHCARNIRVCPVCKEPIPQADLAEHHEKLHKLLPCKQCGEAVCGTDLEDHIRDSCGHTIKSCRFCELELARRELPAHEGYCGARTEQCADCHEWVMLKYRQLHLDSNHGFLRLDDDPLPQPRKDPPKAAIIPKIPNMPKPTNILSSTSNGFVRPPFIKNTNLDNQPRTIIRYFNESGDTGGPSTSGVKEEMMAVGTSPARPQVKNVLNGSAPKAQVKRTNDQPQINTAVAPTNKVNKDLPLSRGGAVKKRPAPKPPVRDPPTADPRRDMAFYSALQRQQEEERKRQEQNAYNLAMGLPPVLNPAAKLEKLRKMDTLHNREFEDTDYKSRLQGRVWMPPDIPAGNILGSQAGSSGSQHLPAERRNPEAARGSHSPDPTSTDDFSNLKPMTPQTAKEEMPRKRLLKKEFMERFNELQLRKDSQREEERRSDRSEGGDRFSEIKSSLRELRRGLNEVTAPYNATNSNPGNSHRESQRRRRRRSPRASPARASPARVSPPRVSPVPVDAVADDDVPLPCEFCGVPFPAQDLVQHQTGCRPDLAQLVASPPRRSPSPRTRTPPSPPPADLHDEPIIPCEFCTESLPIYLITEHQECCRRDNHLLYAD